MAAEGKLLWRREVAGWHQAETQRHSWLTGTLHKKKQKSKMFQGTGNDSWQKHEPKILPTVTGYVFLYFLL